MEYNKKAQIISKIREFLSTVKEIRFAYIFGSFATGYAFNDIDIGIYYQDIQNKSPLEIEFELENRIQEITGYQSDVRILNRAPVGFAFEVIRDGILVKDDSPDLRSDFEGLIFKKHNDFIRFRIEYLRETAHAQI
ncbi:MAG TPA: nucleotidyltransferase domain-containing protein [Desulfobacteraceae bacterium]|nr:nucleotidyltransferase domain-containing protein [Desulfobacteraceae bacterium]